MQNAMSLEVAPLRPGISLDLLVAPFFPHFQRIVVEFQILPVAPAQFQAVVARLSALQARGIGRKRPRAELGRSTKRADTYSIRRLYSNPGQQGFNDSRKQKEKG